MHLDYLADYKKKKERRHARDNAAVSTKTIAARKKKITIRQSNFNFLSSKAPSKLSHLEQSKVDALIMNLIISSPSGVFWCQMGAV